MCLYDIQHPPYHRKTFRAILSFIRQNLVDGLLLGGGALDLSRVSHWNKDLPGNKRKGVLKSDRFDKQILQPLEALLPRACEKVFLTGNHEQMLDQDLAESMPELDGMIDFKQYLRLTERGFKIIPARQRLPDRGPCTAFTVRLWDRAEVMPRRNAVEIPSSSEKKVAAWMSPMVGSVSPRYLKHRANAWANGMTLVYVRDDGTFNLFLVVIMDGEAGFLTAPEGNVPHGNTTFQSSTFSVESGTGNSTIINKASVASVHS